MTSSVPWNAFLEELAAGKTVSEHRADQFIFMQGAAADAMFFIVSGKVKLTVASPDGKEAIIATLGPTEFFGEGCLAGQPARMATAKSVGACVLARVDKTVMARRLNQSPELSAEFIAQLLARLIRYEADLVDQMFNSSEKRLARMLLLLSHFSETSRSETVVNGVNQEHLAQMVGTTRSRINLFMNRFRKLGYITYTGETSLTVHRGLRTVVLEE
jgi:CRP/FNR family transcriptional regulator, cyclic AMP receptor protein